MPELSTELAGATSQAGFAEIDGVGSTVTRTIFSQSERLGTRRPKHHLRQHLHPAQTPVRP
jgi:hypothetical protein